MGWAFLRSNNDFCRDALKSSLAYASMVKKKQ